MRWGSCYYLLRAHGFGIVGLPHVRSEQPTQAKVPDRPRRDLAGVNRLRSNGPMDPQVHALGQNQPAGCTWRRPRTGIGAC